MCAASLDICAGARRSWSRGSQDVMKGRHCADHDDRVSTFPEINRDLRDHEFYPATSETIPPLYATEEIALDQKVVYARYYVQGGIGEWFVMELDRQDETQMLAFGWGEITNGELGYFDLISLESLRIDHPAAPPIIVVRDTEWSPRPWSEVER